VNLDEGAHLITRLVEAEVLIPVTHNGRLCLTPGPAARVTLALLICMEVEPPSEEEVAGFPLPVDQMQGGQN
jgi:hypothetical protein